MSSNWVKRPLNKFVTNRWANQLTNQNVAYRGLWMPYKHLKTFKMASYYVKRQFCDRWTDELMDRRTDGPTDRRTDGQRLL